MGGGTVAALNALKPSEEEEEEEEVDPRAAARAAAEERKVRHASDPGLPAAVTEAATGCESAAKVVRSCK